MMAGSKTLPSKGRIQMSQTNCLQIANPACNARPVHTEVPLSDKLHCTKKGPIDHLLSEHEKAVCHSTLSSDSLDSELHHGWLLRCVAMRQDGYFD